MDDERVVSAAPTKEFFIHMLTRDIGLSRSILDLVDNSVDGALSKRGDERFDGLHVELQIEPERFVISDNCGGIPLDIARRYAFRFGRPKDAGSTNHSIGQFGVGMKRALFKLGSKFQIESTTDKARFVLQEDVDEWLDKPDWQFEFDELEEPEGGFPEEDWGTTITVTRLHEPVADSFSRENFHTELTAELREAHQRAIEKGLSMSLNRRPLNYDPVDLLQSDDLQPVSRDETFNVGDRGDVRVRIVAGVGDSDPQDAGWYVFCNGRLVLGADKTEMTGWASGGEKEVPRFHNRAARFRGYVFFDAEDAGLLPWNTTKTGVDADSQLYRLVRQQMISVMRPIIDFLNQLSREVESEDVERPLAAVLEEASPKRLETLVLRHSFVAPTRPRVMEAGPMTGVISYRRTLDKITKVQEALGVWTQKEVGEGTFDYFYQLECED